MDQAKILVIGATGAIGTYLTPELLNLGYQVDGVTLDAVKSHKPGLRYITGNALEDSMLDGLLCGHYDGIVDFMIYPTKTFEARHQKLLDHTSHLIFLSSYRVYANLDHPLNEQSPQLADVSKDRELLASDDYAMLKCRSEDILERSPRHHWTIVRPSITYSRRRYQLVTLEAPTFVNRAAEGKPVPLPAEAKNVQATMTWAGDVAKMIARLLLKDKAKGEAFTLSTAQHKTWGEIAEIYKRAIGLNPVWIDTPSYLEIMDGLKSHHQWTKWQLNYDRLFDRIVDNRKVLEYTGLVQEDLMELENGLCHELAGIPKNMAWFDDRGGINERMDAYLKSHALWGG